MIWEWISHTVKKNPVTFMLLLTILIGFFYDYIPIPDAKEIHEYPNQPDKPHTNWWFYKFCTIYIIGFIFQINRFFEKISRLDKDVMAVYLCIDILGFFSYYYQGWPEPKLLFIVCFCLGVLIIIGLSIWRTYKL